MENKQTDEYMMNRILLEFIYGIIHEVDVFNEALEPNEPYFVSKQALIGNACEALVKFDDSYVDKRKYLIYKLIGKIDYYSLNCIIEKLYNYSVYDVELLKNDTVRQILNEYSLRCLEEETRSKGE